jgi:hypothetical protein
MGCIYNPKNVQLKTQSTFREIKKINLKQKLFDVAYITQMYVVTFFKNI